MLETWRKLAVSLSLIAATVIVAGFSGRVLCYSDSHVAIEYGQADEQDCESHCGSCVDIPLSQLNAVLKASTDTLSLKMPSQQVIASLQDDSKQFARHILRRSLAPPGVEIIISNVLLALRTIVLLN